MNLGREAEPEQEFQLTLQCSSARPPVPGWPLGWRQRGSPEETSNTHTYRSSLAPKSDTPVQILMTENQLKEEETSRQDRSWVKGCRWGCWSGGKKTSSSRYEMSYLRCNNDRWKWSWPEQTFFFVSFTCCIDMRDTHLNLLLLFRGGRDEKQSSQGKRWQI